MKRSIEHLGIAFGPALLIPLLVACAPRPAQGPGEGTSQPGEPSGQQPGTEQRGTEQPGMQPPGGPTSEREQGRQGAIGEEQQPGREQPYRGRESRGQQQAPSEQRGLGSGIGEQPGGAPAQPGQPGEMGTAMNERALCESLASGGRMRVEDVQGGVAIVISPKGGGDLSTLREDARRLEQAIRGGGEAGGAQRGGVKSGESCGIAELGRLPSVTTQLTEGTNSVRIVMSTSNAAEVRDLRRIARDEVNALNKGAGGAQQRGGQHPGRGQQQPGGRQPGQQQPGSQGQQGGQHQPGSQGP